MDIPFNDNIEHVLIENEEGDLIPVLDHAGAELNRLVRAVVDTGKSGSIILKLELRPGKSGALAVKSTVGTKIPKGLPPESLLWPTPEGNLINEDPRQAKLDLKQISVPKHELKSVTA